MTVLFTIFFISFFALVGFILFRIWELKSGRVAIPIDHDVHQELNTTVRVYTRPLKQFIHRVVLTSLKIWVILTHRIEIFWKEKAQPTIVTYVKKLQPKRHLDPQPKKPSTFIRVVEDYKVKMKKFRQKVREGERRRKYEKEDGSGF